MHYLWKGYPGAPKQYAAVQIVVDEYQNQKGQKKQKKQKKQRKQNKQIELFTSGFIYDTVGWFSEAPDIYEKEVPYAHIQKTIDHRNYQHTMAFIKKHWVARAMPLPAILTHEERDAFWRTLICDRDADGGRLVGSDMDERFDKWIANSHPPFTGTNSYAFPDHEKAVADEAAAIVSTRLNELQQQTQALHKARKCPSEELIKEKRGLQETLAKHRKDDWVKGYTDLAVRRCYDRALITTESHGTLGMAARGVRKGDSILVARGAQAPLIVRKTKNGLWFVVGEAYIHGIMSGEFIVKAMQEGREVETFFLGGNI
ncbi:hypothetical protein F5X99DRAFT_363891 [Biscogniauxia marginata]|nr:hypothetical protein F5X99DRAFT_363891 [Biscogniauxia marginata]